VWEIKQAGGITAEQVIRPTGLMDPAIEIRKRRGQVERLYNECIGGT